MKKIILILEIFVSLFFVILVLIQQRGSLIFSKQEFFLKRRGLEKFIFYLTILMAALFVFLAILNLITK